MMCDPATVVCELGRIADALEKSGVPASQGRSFLTTLLATLTGALISGTVAYSLYRGTSRARYQERYDDHLTKLLQSITDYLREQVKYRVDLRDHTNGPGRLTVPFTFDMITAANQLSLTSRGKEREISMYAHVCIVHASRAKLEDQGHVYTGVADALTAWRLRVVDPESTFAALQELDQPERPSEPDEQPTGNSDQ